MKYYNLIILCIGAFIFQSCKNAIEDNTIRTKTTFTKSKLDTINKVVHMNSEQIDFLMGKFIPKEDDRFVLIDQKYADRSGLYMQKEAYQSFIKMYNHAAKDNVNLLIRSATRNFNYQKSIWEGKWTGKRLVSGKNLSQTIPAPLERAKEILEYSSMPGSSRHHWGTDIDLNSFDNTWFESGKGKQLYDWLQLNASNYGFVQVYTEKDSARPNGYNEERWHWSYTPLSKNYTLQAKKHLKDDMFNGFKGAKTAKNIQIVKNYILGINSKCFD